MRRHRDQADDYKTICKIIAYLSQEWQQQPSLAQIASEVGLDATTCHKLFRRWAGITPKEFLQTQTLDHAKTLLQASASLMDTAYETGLSGTGRLHDLFVAYEAMTPGDYKKRGEGLTIWYGIHPSPFGLALAMATKHGLCGLSFADNEEQLKTVREDMISRWPNASYLEDTAKTDPYVRRTFSADMWNPEDPIKIVLIGTDFEIRVWETLLETPIGAATSYSKIAEKVCSKKAARAVGRAVGKNPIAFVVPCHRVLRKDGGLGGYHWGVTRKKAIIGWEAGQQKNR